MKKIFSILFIACLFATPSKYDFNKLFIEVSQSGSPSVVSIVSEKTEKYINPFFFDPFGNEDPFSPQERKSQGLGSGVIIDKAKGHILTNNHVIDDANEIKVILYDKREVDAELLGSDPLSDLAVLKIDANNLVEATIGNSDLLEIGEWVIAIGSPFSASLSHTVTAGIISALGRNDVMNNLNTYQNFIQTDAAINPGNSGGALLNMKGELIGINAAIASGGGRANAGIGFAIPSTMVKKVMNDLINKGYVVRSFLGIYMQDINEDLYETLDLKTRNGAIVSDIVDGSPASKSGLEEGDVIVSFEGKEISNGSELKNLVSSTDPGSRVKLEIYRDNKKKNIYVILEEREDIIASTSNVNYEFGLLLDNPSEDLINKYNLNEKNPSNIQGVIVTGVEENSPAKDSGLEEGDIITRVGRKKIYSTKDFLTEMSKFDDDSKVLFLVKRGASSRFITITR